MGVNHRRADVFVAQEFLDGADIIDLGQEVRRERMAFWTSLVVTDLSMT